MTNDECGASEAAFSSELRHWSFRHSNIRHFLPIRALRRHLARHNAQALGLATGALGGAALAWGALGFTAYWLALLATTIQRSTDPERFTEVYDARELVGPRFAAALTVGALGLLGLAMLGRRQGWSDALRERRFYLFWTVAELLLLAPNLTLAIWGNLRAVAWLRRRELTLAWRLLRAVGEHERRGERLALAGAGAASGARDTERGLSRALFALQLAELVNLGGDPDEGWFLTLAGEQARTLVAG